MFWLSAFLQHASKITRNYLLRCAVCQYCGATDPGTNSVWQQNYSMCGPCYSLTTCPVCDEPYADAELIIQCSNCDRWLHASDDAINTEDEAEKWVILVEEILWRKEEKLKVQWMYEKGLSLEGLVVRSLWHASYPGLSMDAVRGWYEGMLGTSLW